MINTDAGRKLHEVNVTLKRARFISYLMDSAIPLPGTNYRIGIDPLLGLIPGAGDLISYGISILIILDAAKLGASTTAISKMLLNLCIDTLVGSVPLLGDLFDFRFKANSKNLKILQETVQSGVSTPRPMTNIMRAGILLIILCMAVLSLFITAMVLALFNIF